MSPISSLLPFILLLSLSLFPPSISANPAGYESPLFELLPQRRSPLFDEAGPGYPGTFTLSARAPQNTWAGAMAPSTPSPRTGPSGPKSPTSGSAKTGPGSAQQGKTPQAPVGGRSSSSGNKPPSKSGATGTPNYAPTGDQTAYNGPLPKSLANTDIPLSSQIRLADSMSPAESLRRRASSGAPRTASQGKTPQTSRGRSSSPYKAGPIDPNPIPGKIQESDAPVISPAFTGPPPLPMPMRRRAAQLQALERLHAIRAIAPDGLPPGASLPANSKGAGPRSGSGPGAGAGAGAGTGTGQSRGKSSSSGSGAGAGAAKGQGTRKTSGPGGQMSSPPCVASYASSMGNGGVDPCAGNPNTIMAPSMAAR